MRRHSERSTKTAGHLNELDFEENDEEEVLEQATQGRGRKRKTNGAMENRQPPAKKTRGKRGILKQIIEMPLDLLFEIFGQLEPIDLLNLARTTKELRAFLMKRSSATIWKASLSNVLGLPECPGDLTEPAYVNLVFGKGCQFCLRNQGVIHIVWTARVKTCTKCLLAHFTETQFENLRSFGPKKLIPFIPEVTISRGRRRRPCRYFYSALYEAWANQWFVQNPQDIDKWVSNMVAKRQAIQDHAKACENWVRNLELLRVREQNDLLDQLKYKVAERIEQLGWGDELERIPFEFRKPQEDPYVLKLCQKGLTEQILPDLDKFLDYAMNDIKARRLEKEFKDLLVERIPILDSFFDTYVSTLPVNTIHPSTRDLLCIPIIRDLVINAPRTPLLSVEHFEDIVPMMPDLIHQWQNTIEDKLANLISMTCPTEYNFDRKSVLNLATVWFLCCHCNTQVLRHSRALMHSCAIKPAHGSVFSKEELAILKSPHGYLWNTNQSITFSLEIFKLMTEVVRKSGFNPDVATFEEVDRITPIVECVSCNHVYEGRATMIWWEIVNHFKAYHRKNQMNFEVLDGQEAEKARTVLLETRERQWAAQSQRSLICVRCRERGNMIDLTQHVKKQHGKSKPTEEDIKIILDSSDYEGIYRLWPPRERLRDEAEMAAAFTGRILD